MSSEMSVSAEAARASPYAPQNTHLNSHRARHLWQAPVTIGPRPAREVHGSRVALGIERIVTVERRKLHRLRDDLADLVTLRLGMSILGAPRSLNTSGPVWSSLAHVHALQGRHSSSISSFDKVYFDKRSILRFQGASCAHRGFLIIWYERAELRKATRQQSTGRPIHEAWSQDWDFFDFLC